MQVSGRIGPTGARAPCHAEVELHRGLDTAYRQLTTITRASDPQRKFTDVSDISAHVSLKRRAELSKFPHRSRLNNRPNYKLGVVTVRTLESWTYDEEVTDSTTWTGDYLHAGKYITDR